MTDLLETTPKPGQGIAFDRHEKLALPKRCAIWTGDELIEFHAPAYNPPRSIPRQLDFGVVRDQTGRGVSRRRSIHDISADRCLCTYLVVGKPHGAARHSR